MKPPEIKRENGVWVGRFHSMASLCEILLDVNDAHIAVTLMKTGIEEAYRIERKYSRYRRDNIIYRIYHAISAPITLTATSLIR